LVWILPISTYKHSERRNAIQETWGKSLPVTFYSDHSDEYSIRASEFDDYASAVDKTLNIISILQTQKNSIIKNIMSSKWLFFVDDDTFVNSKKLCNVIQELDRTKIYGELHDYRIQEENGNLNLRDIRQSIPSLEWGLHGGAGILITPRTLKKIRLAKWKNYKVQNGDVAFSVLAFFSGISMVTLKGLNWNNPEYYKKFGVMKRVDEEITFHYVDFESMNKLWFEANL
jgi:hypothetical protein